MHCTKELERLSIKCHSVMAGLGVSLIFTVFVLAEAAYGACRLYWTPSIGNTCMIVNNAYDTWQGAKYSCQSLGGDLITLENRRKEYFVKGWLSSTGEKTCSRHTIADI